MTEKVHYEENLFYISLTIKQVEQSLKLDITPSLFQDKNVADMFFIHRTLQTIYKDLTVNKFLINRDQYLFSLLRVKMSFASLCSLFFEKRDLEKDQNLIDLRKNLEITENDINDIRNIVRSHEDSVVEKDLISAEELNFLMAPDLDID